MTSTLLVTSSPSRRGSRSMGATALQRQISIERIAALSEAADERRPKGTIVGNCRPGGEQPDAIDLGRALCDEKARPRDRRTSQKRDEIPPPHSITSCDRSGL